MWKKYFFILFYLRLFIYLFVFNGVEAVSWDEEESVWCWAELTPREKELQRNKQRVFNIFWETQRQYKVCALDKLALKKIQSIFWFEK